MECTWNWFIKNDKPVININCNELHDFFLTCYNISNVITHTPCSKFSSSCLYQDTPIICPYQDIPILCPNYDTPLLGHFQRSNYLSLPKFLLSCPYQDLPRIRLFYVLTLPRFAKNFCQVDISHCVINSGQNSVGRNFRWDGYSVGQNSGGRNSVGSTFRLGQNSFGLNSVGLKFHWVKIPGVNVPGSKFLGVNVPGTKFGMPPINFSVDEATS